MNPQNRIQPLMSKSRAPLTTKLNWPTNSKSCSHANEMSPINSSWPTHFGTLNSLKDEPKNHCCSLVDPVWRNSTLDHTSTTPSLNRTSMLQSRDYSSTAIDRAIVTVDMEQIAPDAQPHHPFDLQSSDIFVRKPWGIVTNTRTEQVYVTDRQHHMILVFGPDGHYEGVIGEPGKKPGQLFRPAGLAYDAVHDRIVVSDKDNHRIQIFCAATGRFIHTFGSQGVDLGQFRFPWSVAVSPDGELIAVTDARNKRVQLFTSEGIYIRHFKINLESRRHDQPNGRVAPSYLRGIVFDKSGDFVYVTDFNLHRIYRLNVDFTEMNTIVDTGLLRPSGIDVDQDGNLLVCDTKNNRIKVFNSNGEVLGTLTRIGGTELISPLDISVMKAGHVAVLDLNGRIRIF